MAFNALSVPIEHPDNPLNERNYFVLIQKFKCRLRRERLRAQTTAVLDDLRRLVGLLRTDTDATRAVHSLDGLPELVATTYAAGTPVELRVLVVDGARLGDRVGPIAQLAAYRIVQESLANATRHAPGAAVVVEVDDRTSTTLEVTVTNAAPEHAGADGRPGFGLVGMRERATMSGGSMTAGPRGDDFAVAVRMPSHPASGQMPRGLFTPTDQERTAR